jgi:hypothetical protein
MFLSRVAGNVIARVLIEIDGGTSYNSCIGESAWIKIQKTFPC